MISFHMNATITRKTISLVEEEIVYYLSYSECLAASCYVIYLLSVYAVFKQYVLNNRDYSIPIFRERTLNPH